MFQRSDIVEYNGRYGRVMYYDPVTHNVHVMFKIKNNTWRIEKCDVFFCKHAQVFLWTIESVFGVKHMKLKTPLLVPMEIDDDIHVLKV